MDLEGPWATQREHSQKNESMQLRKLLDRPNKISSRLSKISWSTVSKAALTSNSAIGWGVNYLQPHKYQKGDGVRGSQSWSGLAGDIQTKPWLCQLCVCRHIRCWSQQKSTHRIVLCASSSSSSLTYWISCIGFLLNSHQALNVLVLPTKPSQQSLLSNFNHFSPHTFSHIVWQF